MKRSRWLILPAAATVLCMAVSYGVIDAQAVEVVPLAEEQHPDNVGRFAPLEWTPADGPHPGQAPFEQTCQLCHTLNDISMTGPGLRGLEERVPSRARLFHFIVDPKSTDNDDPEDPITQHFLALRRQWNDAMQPRGGNPNLTDDEILAIIDYILRHNWIDFDEAAYRLQGLRGRALVSGARGFARGGPSCITCHGVGSDPDLRGSNIAGNIAHTYFAASQLGGDRDSNYVEGLYRILSGPDAPAMHHYYRDDKGGRPLTERELQTVMVFFEQQMRLTGAEREANYLPIIALILAALGILLVEPGLYARLFVKEEHEYIDGPYEEDDHGHGHGEAHGGPPAPPVAVADDEEAERQAQIEAALAEREAQAMAKAQDQVRKAQDETRAIAKAEAEERGQKAPASADEKPAAPELGALNPETGEMEMSEPEIGDLDAEDEKPGEDPEEKK